MNPGFVGHKYGFSFILLSATQCYETMGRVGVLLQNEELYDTSVTCGIVTDQTEVLYGTSVTYGIVTE